MIRWGNLNGGVIKVLRGTTLPCGCIAGMYETYAGATVAIIDEACAEGSIRAQACPPSGL